MTSMLKRRSAVLVLLLASLTWGCEMPTEPVPSAPESVQVEDPNHLLGGLLGGLFNTSLDLVRTVVYVVGDLGSTLIGPVGGLLEVQDHLLVVPAGAVPHPAEFSMEVITGRTVEVELLAKDPDTGEDVGEKGFNRAVELSLSYADAKLSWWEARKLVIVRIHEDGTREKLPSTVDYQNKRVTAELDHFSKYALCRN